MKYHPVVQKIELVLKDAGVWYETFEHEDVKTSSEASRVRTGYSLGQGAKALILRIKTAENKFFAMVVVPGDKKFDSDKVKQILDAKDIRFATEDEISAITDGVKIGGIPPFGNIFGLKVIADKSLFENEKIVFNAGDRGFSIAMFAKDYASLVKPMVEDIT